jgi:uncharacterized protein YjbJ (UPF0337 family)
MADRESGPKAGAKGVTEYVKGRAKEVAGAILGRDEMRREGQAQREKAAAERDVAAKEAEADKARAVAKVREAQQRGGQD